jgi:putative peptidoglycan lipid II flippase
MEPSVNSSENAPGNAAGNTPGNLSGNPAGVLAGISSGLHPALRAGLKILRPGHAHTAFTATLLLAAAAFGSKLISLVRVKYITHLLGRSPAADAFAAMFQLPDMLSYFLIGGATSITFVTMLTRYREDGRELEGEEALSVILTTMSLVLGAAVLGAEWLAPVYIRHFFPGFTRDPATFALCVHLTRIILPGQLFFLTGGIFGAVLVARRQFTLQAFSPLIYNIGMIVGGALLYAKLGVASIAWGALAGVVLGPFAVNGLGARAAGMRVRFRLDLRNEGLRRWIRSALPLMIGFSLVSVDVWIISYFASGVPGAIAVTNYAKQLFSVPQALGQAAGAASLPFLAALFGREANQPFGRSVNDSVSRLAAVSILITAWLVPLGGTAIDLFLRGGQFDRADAAATAVYFGIFSLALCFWSAQAIYARAFYAANDTLTPMVASTVIVLVSLPVYAGLFRVFGVHGLAWASDLGITLQALTFAVLLHRRRLVRAGGLQMGELGRATLAALVSGWALYGARRTLPLALTRMQEAVVLAVGVLVWAAVCLAVLWLTGSGLPGALRERLRSRAGSG